MVLPACNPPHWKLSDGSVQLRRSVLSSPRQAVSKNKAEGSKRIKEDTGSRSLTSTQGHTQMSVSPHVQKTHTIRTCMCTRTHTHTGRQSCWRVTERSSGFSFSDKNLSVRTSPRNSAGPRGALLPNPSSLIPSPASCTTERGRVEPKREYK